MSWARELIAAGVRNRVFANMLMISILAGGAVALNGLVSETYPDFALDTITVEVPYPGAGAAEIDLGICTRIEESLRGLVGVKRLWSRASEGVGLTVVELRADVADPRLKMLEIKGRVNRVTGLPAGAEPAVVSELIARSKVINVAIYGDAPERTLKELAASVRDDLLRRDHISQIEITGDRDYEISVEVPREALLRYGLTPRDVAAVVARNALDRPAGVLRTSDEEFLLRTTGQRHTASDFEDLVLIARPDGTLIRLGQVAHITDTFVEDYNRGRFQGRPAMMLEVFRTPDQSTAEIARTVRQYVDHKRLELPPGLRIDLWGDNARQVQARIGLLIENGLLGMILVVAVLSVFLDFRLSLYVALGIPISLAGALAVMYLAGQTINMITLFGLIMVTGIIVDDAIVIADGYRERIRIGDPPETAVINGTWRVAIPVLSSSLTTLISFLPLFFVAGVMGKLVAVLPTVVIAAIVFSTIEAFLILPSHLPHCLLTASRPARRRADRMVDALITWIYQPVCRWLLHRRGVAIAGVLAILMLAWGAVSTGRLPFTLLPEVDADVLRARVRFVQGVSAERVNQAVVRLEAAADRLNELLPPDGEGAGPLVQRKFSLIGEWGGWLDERGSDLCEVRIELQPAEKRKLDSGIILAEWARHLGPVHEALSVTFERVAAGPKEAVLQVYLLGDDTETLRAAAEEARRQLQRYAHVHDVRHDMNPGRREVRVRLKPHAPMLGVTLENVAGQLQSGFFGGEAVRVQRQRDEVRVQVRYPADQRQSIADVGDLHVRSSSGQMVPFSEVATYEVARGYASLYREQGQRRACVTAEVDERRAHAGQILRHFEEHFLGDVQRRFPGVRYVHGGERAVIVESLHSLLRGYLVALIVIYAILAAVLKSYIQPLVIMVAIPLGFVGAVAGHLITGYDLNILSVSGMVALSGVVVNDALVLLDNLNQAVRQGTPLLQAALDTGRRRFRAVFLTTLTTVAGLLPLLLERSTQAQHLIPMAVSLAFGLAFATIVTLVLVPVCYVTLEDARRWIGRRSAAAQGVRLPA